jgi:hypothetical protein
MRGKLTVEKANSNMSVFFKAIDIAVNATNGLISRKDFGKIMGDFIDVQSINIDGTENRTPFNKSKFPRYFGFLGLLSINDESHLKITQRGKRLHSFISDHGADFHHEQRYFIANEQVEKVSELFWESILFDSFGRNNSGAEESFTDVDPVKVIIKSLFKLNSCSREELCFIIFGLNEVDDNNSYKFNSFDEAISAIETNREQNSNNYDKYFKKWAKSNIVNDFKILDILSDQNVRVLVNEDNKYRIDERFASSYIEQANSNYFSPYYCVTNELISSEGNEKSNSTWIRDIRLGGVLDENIFVYDGNDTDKPLINHDNKIGQFEAALLKSFEEPKTNIYLWIKNTNEISIEESLKENISLLERVNDFKQINNGFSKEKLPISNPMAIFLGNKSTKAKKKIKEASGLYLPANFHIIIQKNKHE